MAAPLWVIKSICMPYGARLDKLEPLKRTTHFHAGGSTSFPPMGSRFLPGIYRDDPWDGGDGHIMQFPSAARPTLPIENGKIIAGNLDNHEYEFFAGSVWDASDKATCRMCQETFWQKSTRKDHYTKTECSQLIKKLATFLRRDKQCVVCDSRTTRTTWGFPLCDKECVAIFKFWSPGSKRLQVFDEGRNIILTAVREERKGQTK